MILHPRRPFTILPSIASAVLLALPMVAAAASGPPVLGLHGFGDDARAVLSERTLVASIEVDRDQARLRFFTLKERPYVSPRAQEPRYFGDGAPQIEITLLGPAASRWGWATTGRR